MHVSSFFRNVSEESMRKPSLVHRLFCTHLEWLLIFGGAGEWWSWYTLCLYNEAAPYALGYLRNAQSHSQERLFKQWERLRGPHHGHTPSNPRLCT